MALAAYNTTVQLDNASGVLTSLGEVTNVTPFEVTVETVDTTHMTSTSGYRENIATLSAVGQSLITVNFDPGSATDVLVRTAIGDRIVRTLKITYPDTTYQQAECIVIGWAVGDLTPDGKMEATMTVQGTGAPTWG